MWAADYIWFFIYWAYLIQATQRRRLRQSSFRSKNRIHSLSALSGDVWIKVFLATFESIVLFSSLSLCLCLYLSFSLFFIPRSIYFHLSFSLTQFLRLSGQDCRILISHVHLRSGFFGMKCGNKRRSLKSRYTIRRHHLPSYVIRVYLINWMSLRLIFLFTWAIFLSQIALGRLRIAAIAEATTSEILVHFLGPESCSAHFDTIKYLSRIELVCQLASKFPSWTNLDKRLCCA